MKNFKIVGIQQIVSVITRLYKPSARKPWLTVYRAHPGSTTPVAKWLVETGSSYLQVIFHYAGRKMGGIMGGENLMKFVTFVLRKIDSTEKFSTSLIQNLYKDM